MLFKPKQILVTLARYEADVIVVGGVGAVLHGFPVLTDDVDVVPALDKVGLDALARALNALNAKIMSHEAPNRLIDVEWTGNDLLRWIVDFRFLNLMTDFGQLDLIHRPGGTTGYRDLARSARDLEVDDVRVKVAALEDIIRSKEAVGRDRDREQLQTLRRLLEKERDEREGLR